MGKINLNEINRGASNTDTVETNGALNVGHTLSVGSGPSTAAATSGTFTCNGTSNVTITTTAAAANNIVLISLNTVGGTVGAIPKVTTITAGASFTVAGTASDTSVYNWMIIPRL